MKERKTVNYVLLSEGTGQGIEEKSNVSRLAGALVNDDFQRVHLEHGCGTDHRLMGRLIGSDAIEILLRHYKWLSQQGVGRRHDAAIIRPSPPTSPYFYAMHKCAFCRKCGP